MAGLQRIYSAAWKFVNPLEFVLFLHKYDLKLNQISIYILKVDKETSDKQMRQKPYTCAFSLFIEENDPMLHICASQKYVNL